MSTDCTNCPEIHKHDIRLTVVETRTEAMGTRLDSIEKKLDKFTYALLAILISVIVQVGLTVFNMSVGV